MFHLLCLFILLLQLLLLLLLTFFVSIFFFSSPASPSLTPSSLVSFNSPVSRFVAPSSSRPPTFNFPVSSYLASSCLSSFTSRVPSCLALSSSCPYSSFTSLFHFIWLLVLHPLLLLLLFHHIQFLLLHILLLLLLFHLPQLPVLHILRLLLFHLLQLLVLLLQLLLLILFHSLYLFAPHSFPQFSSLLQLSDPTSPTLVFQSESVMLLRPLFHFTSAQFIKCCSSCNNKGARLAKSKAYPPHPPEKHLLHFTPLGCQMQMQVIPFGNNIKSSQTLEGRGASSNCWNCTSNGRSKSKDQFTERRSSMLLTWKTYKEIDTIR